MSRHASSEPNGPKNYFLCFYSQVVNKEFKIMIEINHVTRYSVGAKGNSRGKSKVPDGNDPKTSYDNLYLSHAFAYCFTSNGGV